MPSSPAKLKADLQKIIKKHQTALKKDLNRRLAKEANHEKITEMVGSIAKLAVGPQAQTTGTGS